jgi:small subunit ribosomal protein S13
LSEFRYIVRVVDTDLRGEKSLEYGLTQIKGIGVNLSKAIVKAAKLTNVKRVGDLKDVEVDRIEDVLKNPSKFGIPSWLSNRKKDPETGEDRHLIGSDLVLQVRSDIDLMKTTRSWKGVRHSLGLKVRGQRTKTGARSGRSVSVRRSQLRRGRR